MGRLDGKSALVTGASRGIGRAIAIELAREVGVPLRMCNLLVQEVTEAMNRGWAERDGQSFMLLQQERAGIETIRVPKEQIQAILEREK